MLLDPCEPTSLPSLAGLLCESSDTANSDSKALKATPAKSGVALTPGQVTLIRDRGAKLYAQQLDLFHALSVAQLTTHVASRKSCRVEGETIETASLSESDIKWFFTMFESGTHRDKLSAFSSLCELFPLFYLNVIDDFLTTASKPTAKIVAHSEDADGSKALQRRQTKLDLAEALLTLFLKTLIPTAHELQLLEQRVDVPVGFLTSSATSKDDETLLLGLYLQDRVKLLYFQLLGLLELLLKDPIEHVKSRTLSLIFEALVPRVEALVHKAESGDPFLLADKNLLGLLIDKFSDPSNKISSKAVYLLTQLTQKLKYDRAVNPDAAAIGEDFLLLLFQVLWQNNLGISLASRLVPLKARLTAVVFLSQFEFKPWMHRLPGFFISKYLRLFEMMLALTADDDTKSVASKAVRPKKSETGGSKKNNDKRPAPSNDDGIISHTQKAELTKLFGFVMTGIHRVLPYSSAGLGAFEKEIDSLFKFVHFKDSEGSTSLSSWHLSLQSLWLLYKLVIVSSIDGESNASTAIKRDGLPARSIDPNMAVSLKERYYRALYASLLDSRIPMTSSSKQHHYLQLVYRSLIGGAPRPFLADSLDHEKTLASKKYSLALPTEVSLSLVKEDDRQGKAAFVRRMLLLAISGMYSPPFIVSILIIIKKLFIKDPYLRKMLLSSSDHASQTTETSYDPKKRNPFFANALTSGPLYELLPLLSHFHPSVVKITQQIFLDKDEGESLEYTLFVNDEKKRDTAARKRGRKQAVDPFDSFSVRAFLNRFIYSNPKKAAEGTCDTRVAVSSKEFLNDERSIPAHERFFYKYFHDKREDQLELAAKKAKAKSKKAKKLCLSDDSDFEDDVDESLLDLYKNDPELLPSNSDNDDDDDNDSLNATSGSSGPEFDEDEASPDDFDGEYDSNDGLLDVSSPVDSENDLSGFEFATADDSDNSENGFGNDNDDDDDVLSRESDLDSDDFDARLEDLSEASDIEPTNIKSSVFAPAKTRKEPVYSESKAESTRKTKGKRSSAKQLSTKRTPVHSRKK